MSHIQIDNKIFSLGDYRNALREVTNKTAKFVAFGVVLQNVALFLNGSSIQLGNCAVEALGAYALALVGSTIATDESENFASLVLPEDPNFKFSVCGFELSRFGAKFATMFAGAVIGGVLAGSAGYDVLHTDPNEGCLTQSTKVTTEAPNRDASPVRLTVKDGKPVAIYAPKVG
jgi:hypothetical protein